MKARDIMSSETECVAATDTLEQAARRLAELGVGAMPICGEDDRLKGMLTDRDIVVKAVAKGKDLARTLVGELAEGKPVTIGADDSADETLKTMERHQVRRLPVIDGRRLVGIVSQADIARRLPKRKAGELLSGVSATRGKRPPRKLVGAAPIIGLGAAALAYVVRGRSGGRGTVRTSTVVEAPVAATYGAWTRFEEFPSFMDGIEEVRQVDDTHLHWRATVGGKTREWDARIVEQVPDQRVVWESTSGTRNDGVVRFASLGADRTRVDVELAFAPTSVTERVGSAIGLADRRVKADLERFRKLVEQQGGEPSGGWRGEVN